MNDNVTKYIDGLKKIHEKVDVYIDKKGYITDSTYESRIKDNIVNKIKVEDFYRNMSPIDRKVFWQAIYDSVDKKYQERFYSVLDEDIKTFIDRENKLKTNDSSGSEMNDLEKRDYLKKLIMQTDFTKEMSIEDCEELIEKVLNDEIYKSLKSNVMKRDIWNKIKSELVGNRGNRPTNYYTIMRNMMLISSKLAEKEPAFNSNNSYLDYLHNCEKEAINYNDMNHIIEKANNLSKLIYEENKKNRLSDEDIINIILNDKDYQRQDDSIKLLYWYALKKWNTHTFRIFCDALGDELAILVDSDILEVRDMYASVPSVELQEIIIEFFINYNQMLNYKEIVSRIVNNKAYSSISNAEKVNFWNFIFKYVPGLKAYYDVEEIKKELLEQDYELKQFLYKVKFKEFGIKLPVETIDDELGKTREKFEEEPEPSKVDLAPSQENNNDFKNLVIKHTNILDMCVLWYVESKLNDEVISPILNDEGYKKLNPEQKQKFWQRLYDSIKTKDKKEAFYNQIPEEYRNKINKEKIETETKDNNEPSKTNDEFENLVIKHTNILDMCVLWYVESKLNDEVISPILNDEGYKKLNPEQKQKFWQRLYDSIKTKDKKEAFYNQIPEEYRNKINKEKIETETKDHNGPSKDDSIVTPSGNGMPEKEEKQKPKKRFKVIASKALNWMKEHKLLTTLIVIAAICVALQFSPIALGVMQVNSSLWHSAIIAKIPGAQSVLHGVQEMIAAIAGHGSFTYSSYTGLWSVGKTTLYPHIHSALINGLVGAGVVGGIGAKVINKLKNKEKPKKMIEKPVEESISNIEDSKEKEQEKDNSLEKIIAELKDEITKRDTEISELKAKIDKLEDIVDSASKGMKQLSENSKKNDEEKVQENLARPDEEIQEILNEWYELGNGSDVFGSQHK